LPKNSNIFVRADLHGDLKSLVENLKAMQKKGLVDENFKCKPDTYMVFCGDYVDRGDHSLEVLEFLATLKMENPDQVFLIRGNHEYIDSKQGVSPLRDSKLEDRNYLNFWKSNGQVLTNFYETMPLTVYIAEKEGEYVQFTHGLFEVHVDPIEILETEKTKMTISKGDHSFSDRVKQLATAKRIMDLKKEELKHRVTTLEETAYNWGDLWDESTKGTVGSKLDDLGSRSWYLTVDDVACALSLMSEKRKVRVLFRGHQHKFQHGVHKGKVVVTTLPVGMDSQGYKTKYSKQQDRAYILETSPNIEDWKKRAFFRESGETCVEVSSYYSIFSDAI